MTHRIVILGAGTGTHRIVTLGAGTSGTRFGLATHLHVTVRHEATKEQP